MNTNQIIKIFKKFLIVILTLTFSLLIKFPNMQRALYDYLLFISIPLTIIYYITNLKMLKFNFVFVFLFNYVLYYIFQDIGVSNISIGSGVFWWIFLLFFLPYFNSLKKKDLIFSIKIFLIVTVIILFIDFIYRFYLNPTLVYFGPSIKGIKYNFYLYKFGLIGADANTTGVVSSFCFLGSLILKKMEIIKNKKISFIFFIFTIFTFSRAAIITVIVLYFLYLMHRKKLFSKKVLITLIFILIIIMIFFFINDKSGKARLEIIQNAFLAFLNLNLKEMLFGINFDLAFINGKYLHLLLLLLIFQKGIIGFLLFAFFMFYLFRKVKALRLILLAYIIEGFSFAPLSNPILSYFIIVFICLKKFKYYRTKAFKNKFY